MNPRCAWKHCRSRDVGLTYLGRPLCRTHWLRLCQWQGQGRDAEARAQLGLRPRRNSTHARRGIRPKGADSLPDTKTRERADSDAGGLLALAMMAALALLLFMWLGIDCDEVACCCALPFLY